jgi:hypothetical protein
MNLWQIIFIALATTGIITLVNAIHEIGHLLFCIMLRCKVVSIKIYAINYLNTDTHKHIFASLRGHNHCSFKAKSRAKGIIIILAGSFFDAVCCLILYILFLKNRGSWYCWPMLFGGIGSALSIIYNAIPSVNGDGKLLYDTLGGKR